MLGLALSPTGYASWLFPCPSVHDIGTEKSDSHLEIDDGGKQEDVFFFVVEVVTRLHVLWVGTITQGFPHLVLYPSGSMHVWPLARSHELRKTP